MVSRRHGFLRYRDVATGSGRRRGSAGALWARRGRGGWRLQRRGGSAACLLAGALLALGFLWAHAETGEIAPARVTFGSADGKTTLVGYLYRPRGARAPAVVMMHGRAGAYSVRAEGVYDANTLSLRHKAWGRAWAEAGYVALLVDGFGPRGYPA